MTREKAKYRLYDIINSGILDEELEQDLIDIANCICIDDFEKCRGNEYCEGCQFMKDNEE